MFSDFDCKSGSLVERTLFNNRLIVLSLFVIVTVILSASALGLRINASFEKMIPVSHPYIANYLANKNELQGMGNTIRIAVETKGSTILDARYMETLRQISDEAFLLPGVDRPYVRSLWTPTTRWMAVTEDGLDGGPVVADNYDGAQGSLEQLRINIERSGEIGHLVANDFHSSIIILPLLDRDQSTGKPLDYRQFSRRLEELRKKFETADIKLHITGFAKIAGDLMEGMAQVLGFFVFSCGIAICFLFWFTRCLRSTILVVVCSLVAVVWQLGLMATLGYDLDPYSILVPFLVFAIGMSHGAQKMNGVMQDVGRGASSLIAARSTFRRLFVAGLTALVCDAVGFAVLLLINIEAIRELAIAASIGVAVLVFTNLILLPILLSYTGVSAKAALRSLKHEQAESKHMVWQFLDLFTQRRWAYATVAVALILAVIGSAVSSRLRVGDLDPGAPELRPDSVYNTDNAYLVNHYSVSSDILVVMVKTAQNDCATYQTLERMDALEWQLRQLPGVESTSSLAALGKQATVGMNEGSLKWFELVPNQSMINAFVTRAPRELFNQGCNLGSMFVFLKDHKADTLTAVVNAVEAFAARNNSEEHKFLLGAGNAGIEAATNIVVERASRQMLFWVYGAVAAMCLITFRSWRAVVVAMLPLVLTSILGEALMVVLGIGLKVATLPVIALGVGIGVDYALYVYSVTLARLREGMSLSEAYYQALLFTGKVVMFTGLTLAAGVVTWGLSPIKFQADMGILLAAMFVWNMVGALVLLPALAVLLPPCRQVSGGHKLLH